MGCKYCPTGTGEACDGPESIDDIERCCDCPCHAIEDGQDGFGGGE